MAEIVGCHCKMCGHSFSTEYGGNTELCHTCKIIFEKEYRNILYGFGIWEQLYMIYLIITGRVIGVVER